MDRAMSAMPNDHAGKGRTPGCVSVARLEQQVEVKGLILLLSLSFGYPRKQVCSSYFGLQSKSVQPFWLKFVVEQGCMRSARDVPP
eukprot:5178459-Amphidinium_carterae.2